MPTEFEIHIFGICFCFHRDEHWNIIFPCDDNHPVNFCYNGSKRSLRRPGRAIDLSFQEEILANGDPFGPSTAPLFNMSDDYCHETTGGVSNLWLYDLSKPHPEDGVFYDFVWLKIPNATLYGQTPSSCPYYVQNAASTGLPTKNIDPRAREVVITFKADATLTLLATDKRDSRYTDVAFTSQASGKHIIEIDNDCHEHCPEENDFLHLYRIVTDVNPDPKKKGRKFAAGQTQCSSAQEERTFMCLTAAERENLEYMSLTLATPYGNCDPVESNPPPGGP